MAPTFFTENAHFSGHARLNRYRKVGVYPDGADGHRARYEGPCFICGAPITVTKVWHCAADKIPDMIRDRCICNEHN